MLGLDVFAYTGLINAITSLSLGCILLRQKTKKALISSFCYFSFSVSFWAINYFFWLSTSQYTLALIFIRLSMVGAIFIPALFTKFVFNLIEKKNNSIILLNWLCVICFLPFSFSNIFISGLEQRMMFSYWPIPGLLFHFVLFYFIANTIYAHVLLWSAIKMMSGNQKMQVIWVFAGTLIGFIGGSTNYFLWYGIPVTPSLNILVSLYIITVAYAIVKLRFFDINVIIKKTFVFAGLLAFVFGVFSAATFIVRDILGRYLGVNNFWINAISIFLIVLGYDPIRRFLVNLTDTYLFQKKYDYQKLLKDASRGISKIKSLQHLLSLVVHFITMRMRVTNAAVLSKQDEDNRFKLVYQRGFKKNFMEYFIDHDSELIRYLSFEHEAIDIEMVNDGIEAGNKKVIKGQESREYDFEAIKRTMEEIETSCCIPSFLGKELRNVLILGEKKSGDYYVEADLNVLYTLAQESAIAIENARLYDEARNKAKELGDINGQLEYAKNLLMKALNDTEVANKQLQDTQAQLIHEQKMATLGRLAASVGHEVNNPLTILSMNVSRVLLKLRKNPDLKVNEIMDTFDKMEQNIGRIKAVVNTLTGLLKKSEKGKFEPLSLKLILEETLPLVQFQTYLDNLTGTEVDFEVPGNLPLVRGDLERLQEVFLNLFINAYHAMEGKQYRRIRVTAEVDPTDKDMVCIRFQDNGKGMDDETRKKIFNYRFTTKAPGKGSGLGLYMCKYIVELHGGSMHVNSKLDEGTTFVIGLPSSDKKLVLPEGDMSQPPPHAGEDQASA